jgi:hypothetical protein
MNFPATIYVDSDGVIYGAADTDQRFTRKAARTVKGRPVACAGSWYGSQMEWQPFRDAVAEAKAKAGKV